MSEHRYPPKTLRVIIRDAAPLAIMQEPVSHRSVSIELTDEQMERLRLHSHGSAGGAPIYEEVSLVFFEEGVK